METQYYHSFKEPAKPTRDMIEKGLFTWSYDKKRIQEYGPGTIDDDFLLLPLEDTYDIWLLQPVREVNLLNFDVRDAYENNKEFFLEYEDKEKGKCVSLNFERIREKFDGIESISSGIGDYFKKNHGLTFIWTLKYYPPTSYSDSIIWLNWAFEEPVYEQVETYWPHSASFEKAQNERKQEKKRRESEIDIKTKYADGPLETMREVATRKEQVELRGYLFNNKKVEKCGICGEVYPVNMLVAAHIKKRSECDSSEKLDKKIVMPMCTFGCDDLYEKGYISVKNKKIVSNNQKFVTDPIQRYVEKLENRTCKYYSKDTKKYFQWHRTHHGFLPN